MTLTRFLLARFDEDEAAALAVPVSDISPVRGACSGCLGRNIHALGCPVRALAEVRAKRRVVQTQAGTNRAIACLLALPYADHPDYRQEWSTDA